MTYPRYRRNRFTRPEMNRTRPKQVAVSIWTKGRRSEPSKRGFSISAKYRPTKLMVSQTGRSWIIAWILDSNLSIFVLKTRVKLNYLLRLVSAEKSRVLGSLKIWEIWILKMTVFSFLEIDLKLEKVSSFLFIAH